jgi:beta-lactamase class A
MKFFSCLFLVFFMTNANAQQYTAAQQVLLDSIRATLAQQKGEFAMAFRNTATGETILLNEHQRFHAASTMKTPVMIELYKQAAAGKFSMNDQVTVKNEFKSIVDSSLYQLDASDDSQQELYKEIGNKRTIYELMYQMIILSSNLATNILIELVGGTNVTQSMRELGAKDIQVLRGVEDNKAYAKGLNNTTTAYDLMLIFDQMARGKAVSQQACDGMIRILLDQKFNEIIPARLPAGVKVAHKTGSITALHHDSGIVFLPDGRKYALVLLSAKLEDEKSAVAAMARVSELVYGYVASRP